MAEDRMGKKNWMWKGGIQNERSSLSREEKKWRKKVFIKNDFTCQKDGIKGGQLQAHHIKNWAQFSELRFEVNNGITFCKKHHKLFHRIYGTKNNNLEQVKEFIKEENICK